MYSLLKYFHVSHPFYDRIPQWSAWLGNARTALRTQSRRCFSAESDDMTQVQPRPANPVDLTSTSFSFEWSLRCKIKLLTLHKVSVSQVKDQFLHISSFPIQIQIAFTGLAGAPYFLSSFISPFPNLEPQPQQSTNHLGSFLLGAAVWGSILHHALTHDSFLIFVALTVIPPQKCLLLCLKQAGRCSVFC